MHTEKLLQITQGSGDLLYAGEDTVVERLGRVLAALDEASASTPSSSLLPKICVPPCIRWRKQDARRVIMPHASSSIRLDWQRSRSAWRS